MKKLVALVALSVDDDLTIEREGHERHLARRDGLAEPFPDEPAVAEDGDGTALELRVRGIAQSQGLDPSRRQRRHGRASRR